MSQDRQKDEVAAPRAAGAPATAANPGRSTLTTELGEGDGLPYRQRSLFEKSTGADLSGVRVHTNDAAADAATGVGARAYAVGQDIVFNRGQYQPGTPEGDALLAHEVAHTVQQGHAENTGSLATTSPGDRAETGADQAASSMLAGTPTSVEAQPVAVARKMMDERVEVPSMDGSLGGGPHARGIDDGGGMVGEPGVEGGESAKPADGAKSGEEEGGELTAERVGMEEEEGTEPVGPPQNLEKGKQDLAAKAGGGEGVDGGGAGVEGGAAGGLEGAGGGGGGGGPAPDAGGDDGGGIASPELVAAVEGAQSDAQEAQSQAKGESEAFQAEMKAQRDQFDAQQMAITRDKLATMSPADKRSTLIEMGWDKKKVKKLKDHELDGIIEGKFETEARKSKIMGMTPEELAELTPAQKVQHLVDLGIDKKDLDKIGPQKACKAFDDIMRLAHVPGKHKVKIKIKGGFFNKKEWVVKINCDADGNAEITPEKKGGFFSKLWGWVKALLPIILTVLGPITGGISLIVLAVYQTVVAIQTGDWLGAVIGIAGAFVGLGALKAVQNSVGAIAKGLKKVADVARKVKKIADAAKQAMTAAQAKNPGSLLAAIAQGASAFASFGAKFADKFSIKMDQWSVKLDKWAGVIRGGEKVLQGVKSGDPLMAIGGAFETASAAVGGKSQTGKNLTRAANITNFASVGKRALQARPPDYAAVAEAALGIAGQLKEDRRIDDAARIVGSANRLRQAIASGDAGAIAQAGLELAQAIQVAKYDADNKEEKDKDGNPLPDEKRDAIIARYTKAQNVVRAADTLIKAASARPRPNYIAALDAVTQMVAELTESKRIDQAAVITSAFSRWTSAVNSKNQKEILDAAIGLGDAINGMRDLINKEREDAKKEAEAQLGPGETLPTGDAGELGQITPGDLAPGSDPAAGEEPLPTSGRDFGDLMPGAPGVRPVDGGTEPTGPGPQPAAPRLNPRGNTPNANYTVFSGDSLGRISQAFKVSLAELRRLNPQIVNNQIFAGQKLFVPGAEVVPEGTVTTDVSFPGPAPGPAPGSGASVPPTGASPAGADAPAPRGEVPADLSTAINIIKAFATFAGEIGHPGAKQAIATWESYIATEKTLRENGKTASEEYKDVTTSLKALAQTGAYAEAIAKEFASYERAFGDPENLAAVKAMLPKFRTFKAHMQRVSRLGAIPGTFLSAADSVVIVCGVKMDGSAASVTERIGAAQTLLGDVASLPGELAWAGRVASAILRRFGAGASAVAAINLVRNTVNAMGSKVGDKVGGVVMRWVTPLLEKVAAREGAEKAMVIAQKLATELPKWADEFVKSKAVGNQAIKLVLNVLGPRIGLAFRFAFSGPFAIALEVAKLEAEFAADLYATAYSSISMFLSQRAFGAHINVLKNQIATRSFDDHEQMQAFFDHLINKWLAGGMPDVRHNWRNAFVPAVVRLFPQEGSQLAADPYGFLRRHEDWGKKWQAAWTIKQVAPVFLDREYERIFGEKPL